MNEYYSLTILAGGICGVFGILIGLGINNRKILAYQRALAKYEELLKLKNAYIHKLKRRIAVLIDKDKYIGTSMGMNDNSSKM